MTLLTLVRHAQTRDNAEGRWEGRRDSPLTAEGHRQIEALGRRLKSTESCAGIYASSLGRAIATAQLLSGLLDIAAIKTDPRLAEYDFGAWDGLASAELQARGFWRSVQEDPRFTPPQGESFAHAATRVVTAIGEIAASHPNQRIVLVGHGLTLAAALAEILDDDVRRAPAYALGNCGIAQLVFDGPPRLIHLDPIIS
jgi:broad specificity phosphatase PhoE